MEISLINSQALLHLLSLTEKKEEILKGVEEVENEIAKTIKGAVTPVAKTGCE